MRLEPSQRVPLDECKRRALSVLSRRPMGAQWVAHAIWPGHKMKAQGAGAAASRILKHLERERKARWHSERDGPWGWRLW